MAKNKAIIPCYRHSRINNVKLSTKLVHLVFLCTQSTVFVFIYNFGWGGRIKSQRI